MNRAFTLIELLVVIAIIGLLSSVVLASLNSARLKAADAAIREEAVQLRSTLELENSETGSYTNIQQGGGWYSAGQACGGMAGNYAGQAQSLCAGLLQRTGTACGSYCVYFNSVYPADSSKYTIMVYLPYASAAAGSPRYLCVGSSGAQSTSPFPPPFWVSPGCWANP